VVEQIKSPDVRVYAVWVPILVSDVKMSVPRATNRLPDERVSHYWDSDGEMVRAYSRILQLGDKPAWDVYFVFDRNAEWGSEPPAPVYWMDQLGIAPERRLDGNKLAAEVNRLLQGN
jgi:hypothetical protein